MVLFPSVIVCGVRECDACDTCGVFEDGSMNGMYQHTILFQSIVGYTCNRVISTQQLLVSPAVCIILVRLASTLPHNYSTCQIIY